MWEVWGGSGLRWESVGWEVGGSVLGGRWVGVGGCMGWEKAEVGVCEVGVGYCAKCLHVECE